MENLIKQSKNSFWIEHTAHFLVTSQNQNVRVYHVLMDIYNTMFYGDFWTFDTNYLKLPMNFSKLQSSFKAIEWKFPLN